MSLRKISQGAIAWHYLNGIVNIFKPAYVSVGQVRKTIIYNLCKDLNQLKTRPPRYRVDIKQATSSHFEVKVEEDLADNVLTIGSRYQMDDLKCGPAATLGLRTSGVLILGINNGLKLSTKLHVNRPIRVYHVSGRLGTSTETNFCDARITSKSTYSHVNLSRLNGLLSSMQASHQQKMFELSGVDIQSQAAFELACKGTVRPNSFKVPIIYGLKCIEFNTPEFKVEIHALNENEIYFGTLIQEIGLQLHSVAHCVGIRCVRHGHFNFTESLLRKDWNLQSIKANIQNCRNIFKKYPYLLRNQKSHLISNVSE